MGRVWDARQRAVVRQQAESDLQEYRPDAGGIPMQIRVASPGGVMPSADPIEVPVPEAVSSALVGAGYSYTNALNSAEATAPPPPGAASFVGQAAPYALAALLPGTAFRTLASGVPAMMAQGLTFAGIKALDPDAELKDILTSGALAAAGQAVGDIAGRAITGAGGRLVDYVARKIGQPGGIVKSTSERLTTLSETFGGLGLFNKQQQQVLNRAAVEAIGEVGDTLTPGIRRAAAERIGAELDSALPTGPLKQDLIDPILALLDDIPDVRILGKKRLRSMIKEAQDNPQTYQAVMAELRDKASDLAGSDREVMRQITSIIDLLADAGTDAGAKSTRVVREQYKNLMLLESIPSVRNYGMVPAVSANSKLWQGYGGTHRKVGEGTLPATQRLFQVTADAAEELSKRYKSSGTTERALQAGAAQDVVGVMTGTQSPSALLRTFGGFTVGGAAGLASTGSRGAGRVTGALGAALTSRIGDPDFYDSPSGDE